MSMMRFEGKRALVTGASSGIGRATALRLAQEGAIVLTTGRRDEALQELIDELGSECPVGSLAGDLRDDDFRKLLCETVEAELGGLEILVNAAGIIGSGNWESTGLDAYDAMMDINLRSVYDLTRRLLPLLIRTKGNVVNVSSVTGTRAFPGVLAYCVSKAGLDQLTRCLALELAPTGVRINAVNPGVVRTGLHRSAGMDEKAYAAFVEHSKDTHPLGRIGEPAELASLIAFLASDESGWITGETIAIDGGRQLTCAR
jgi:NAD(P)-dependent dehydrogenase (short-subunit alcohol dehydrogenase family)